MQQVQNKLEKTVLADSISQLAEIKTSGFLAATTKPMEAVVTGKEKYTDKLELKMDQLSSVTKKTEKLTAGAADIAVSIQSIPKKYFNQVSDKADKYSSRITKKTEKTLERLCRWEEKVRRGVEKASPEAAQQLFGNGEMTFASLLKKVKEKESLVTAYKTQYNGYLDTLSVSLRYLQQQKEKLSAEVLQPVMDAETKIKNVTAKADTAEILEQLIKDRKKKLMETALQYMGKNNYLSKINKETWYYAETMKNYKEIFSDAGKAEQTAKEILGKVLAFQNFIKENSVLTSLFGGLGSEKEMEDLTGLQTRNEIQDQLRSNIAGGGPDAQQLVSQNIQNAREQLNNLKDKITKQGGDNSEITVPDFKPNTQKTKTFLQRIEYGTNIQFAKNNSLVPSTADLGLQVGYKLNDKSVIGVGASYKLGIGSFDHIKFTHQGVGIRSYIDWQLKRNFFVSGGFEMNQNAQVNNTDLLKEYSQWQSAGLIGISKKLKINTGFFKATKLQLFYDIFSRHHIPVSQPILFRVGYSFSK